MVLPLCLALIHIFLSPDDFEPKILEPGQDPLEFDLKKAYAEKDVEKMEEVIVNFICLKTSTSPLISLSEKEQNTAIDAGSELRS